MAAQGGGNPDKPNYNPSYGEIEIKRDKWGGRLCAHKGCNKYPVYNKPGETTGLYCSKHKEDGMIDVKSKRCKTPHCDTLAKNRRYKGYCLSCFVHMFPGEKVARNYKTKEASVAEFVMKQDPELKEFTWIWDKRVMDGCSLRRPDLLCDFGDYVVIVEIDENQHIAYDCSCQNKRLMQISKDVGHRPLVFIRFNPDTYLKRDGTQVRSCWGPLKTGVLVIKKKKTTEWLHRLDVLKQQIIYWSQNKTTKTIEVVQLFYDDCE